MFLHEEYPDSGDMNHVPLVSDRLLVCLCMVNTNFDFFPGVPLCPSDVNKRLDKNTQT